MAQGRILIIGGRIIDPCNKLDEIGDVLVENGLVVACGGKIDRDDCNEIIDAAGMWVVPGLIDLHVHFREPGFEHKEDMASGAEAAALGGFTTVCIMANTKPVVDNARLVHQLKKRAAEIGLCDILSLGAISEGLAGKKPAELEEMGKAGVCGFSDDGFTVIDTELYRRAMDISAGLGLPIFAHCEDLELEDSVAAEESIVARDIEIAGKAGVHLHICHASTAASVEHIRRAKKNGLRVTAEVAPHHFALCVDDIPGTPDGLNTNFKMAPPIRSRADMLAMQSALADGTIDAIATDHAPHHIDEKNLGWMGGAPNGIIGLETSVAVSITHLVQTGILTPTQLVDRMSAAPARILGSSKGQLGIHAAADITIIDPNAKCTVSPDKFASKARNTPFGGMELTGKVIHTIQNGRVIVRNSTIRRGDY